MYLSDISHQLSRIKLRDTQQVSTVGLVDTQQRKVQCRCQLIKKHTHTNTHKIIIAAPQLTILQINYLCSNVINHWSVHVCWAQTILTFRNVALSLVTMDGLTLMLSCIIDVKLQNKT